MHRTRWRPPEGATHGVCPACHQWAPLTEKGYIAFHHETRPGPLGSNQIRCVAGIGRDPLAHTCITPVLTRVEQANTDWTCRCGLKWHPTVVGSGAHWTMT